jgi:dTDP-4-dehydrorhamnose reductase
MKYLLTGGTGVLGKEVQKHLVCFAISSKEWDISVGAPMGFYNQYQREMRGVCCIIHAGAYTDVPKSEINRRDAIDINIFGTKYVKDLASIMGIKMVYISTDYIYEGEVGNYDEESMPKPFNFYGFTKLAGESYMDNKDLIIRTSFKPNIPWPFPKAFTDLYTSADYVDVVAEQIAILIKSGASGVYNVGTERKSVYDLAVSRNPDVLPMSREDIKSVKLPRDISMDITKLKNNI